MKITIALGIGILFVLLAWIDRPKCSVQQGEIVLVGCPIVARDNRAPRALHLETPPFASGEVGQC